MHRCIVDYGIRHNAVYSGIVLGCVFLVLLCTLSYFNVILPGLGSARCHWLMMLLCITWLMFRIVVLFMLYSLPLKTFCVAGVYLEPAARLIGRKETIFWCTVYAELLDDHRSTLYGYILRTLDIFYWLLIMQRIMLLYMYIVLSDVRWVPNCSLYTSVILVYNYWKISLY